VARAGQQPILLLGDEPAGEPLPPLRLPFGEVAHLGKLARLAHRVDQPVELRMIGEEIGGEPEHPRERLVEEGERAIAAELGDAGRQAIEHVALGASEARQLGAGTLAILDVDRIAGHAAAAERHLDDAHHPSFAGDGGRNDAVEPRRRAAFRHGELDRRRRLVGQFDSALDDRGGILRLHRRHIGAVDQSERQVRPAMPHRERRRLDQPRQRLERLRAALEPGGERGGAILRLGRVGEPQENGAGAEAGRRRAAIDPPDARRARQPRDQCEWRARGGLGDARRERGGVVGQERTVGAEQVGPAFGQGIEGERAGEPVRPRRRAVVTAHQRQCRPGLDQRRQPIALGDHRRPLRPPPPPPQRRPNGHRQPCAGEQGGEERKEGLGRHGMALMPCGGDGAAEGLPDGEMASVERA
jgi:hypothetical protein